MISLTYDKGTILIKGNIRVPNTTWDARSNCYRALALYYRDILEYLKNSELEYSDEVLDLMPCPSLKCKKELDLRDYQKKALDAWLKAGKKGTIVLPTGAGKTIIAIKAISILNEPAMIIVPTLDLMDQWHSTLSDRFDQEIGIYGGGTHILKPITVATYDTAYLKAEFLGNKFSFLIFDEVHHLPSPGYMHIAEMFASPYRLGLTATYEREDDLHEELTRLIGGKVFEIRIDELAGKHLAEYDVRMIKTDLMDEERAEYERMYRIFLDYIHRNNIILKTPKDFQRFIIRSATDPDAREALVARKKARSIALNSISKLDVLRDILEDHRNDRIIIFTEHNDLVYKISREFLIPAITHRSGKEERKDILDGFRSGRYNAIVSSKVLDEGIDVPEANIGVILSGSGSTREFRQRLGRLLRKKGDKKAILYEIVSKETTEVGISRRRKRECCPQNA